ncbi:hypothetical protein NDU88_000531 [Pleurodeles waltl]|uniref:Uncharacterized protein n=1 Tax=Pleurodeles waltl TaxID=8319 RepID=A0AAV7NCZ7_PLEWA|nr:hypothetical protein NDU88_000531 [Pleurodeles waltl]
MRVSVPIDLPAKYRRTKNNFTGNALEYDPEVLPTIEPEEGGREEGLDWTFSFVNTGSEHAKHFFSVPFPEA